MGIMNATGDSTHPLEYLIISSITNIILDIFFIKVLHTGVGGAAAATTIGQGLSFILCLRRLLKSKEIYRVEIRKITFCPPILKEIIRYGLPSGVQNSVIFGPIFSGCGYSFRVASCAHIVHAVVRDSTAVNSFFVFMC